jgi:hypothetical protein
LQTEGNLRVYGVDNAFVLDYVRVDSVSEGVLPMILEIFFPAALNGLALTIMGRVPEM